MTTLRRFLVVQALMVWQGGFLFYAAIVVPSGTNELGPFAQGRVTRHVTDALNVIGLVALAVLAWDQWQTVQGARCRWGLWGLMVGCLAGLAIVHWRIEAHVNFTAVGSVTDYAAFYAWHRAYLWLAILQWLAALAYVAIMLRNWRNV